MRMSLTEFTETTEKERVKSKANNEENLALWSPCAQ